MYDESDKVYALCVEGLKIYYLKTSDVPRVLNYQSTSTTYRFYRKWLSSPMAVSLLLYLRKILRKDGV